MEPVNILVIEDDAIVARTIERSLRSEDFRVTVTNSGVEGLKTARRRPPDLVILDVIMPGMDGYTVCREIRSDPLLREVPVLFLTAKIKDEDRLTGFDAGADDYLCKPFNINELIMRVRAILRRVQTPAAASQPAAFPETGDGGQAPRHERAHELLKSGKRAQADRFLVVGGYSLDIRSYELHTPHPSVIRLTPMQFDLLYQMMKHPDQIFSPSRILEEVWGYPSGTGSPDLVRVHIKNLRERVEVDPRSPKFIRTVAGYGYTVGPAKEVQ